MTIRRKLRVATVLVGMATGMSACGPGGVSAPSDPAENAAAATTAGTPATPSLSKFVLYAERSIIIGNNSNVNSGDIGVRTSTPTSFGAQLSLGGYDVVNSSGTLFAPSVLLGINAQVGGVETDALTQENARLGRVSAFPASLMPRLPLALGATGAGTAVTVAGGQVKTLVAGAYDTLAVADQGEVRLGPGIYSFTTVTLGEHARLFAQPGGVKVRVTGAFTAARWSTVAPLGSPTPAASGLTISVTGGDGPSGAYAFEMLPHSSLTALVSVPHGTLALDNTAVAKGAFAGFDVVAGSNVTLTFQSGFPADAQQPVGQQQLAGYITPDIASAPLLGPVPPSANITLWISLPVQTPTDFPSLRDFAQQVSDPTNARYRQFLTPDQYASHYRPSDDSYNALIAFATGYGLTVTNNHPDHELLEVAGTVGQVEQMLFANMNHYQRPDGSQFYALDREPSLGLALPILRVAGTSNFSIPRPRAMPSGPMSDLIGNDFRTAYVSGCAAGLDGAGQSIGVLAFEGFTNADIQAYIDAAGIAGLDLTRVTFSASWPDEHLDVPTVGTSGEATLDVETAHAMAPGARIILYQSPTGGQFGVDYSEEMMHAMAHPPSGVPLSNQLSTSWTIENDDDIRQSLDAMAAQGQTFVQSSGDGGAFTANPSDIRSPTNTTIVGGTIINAFGAGMAPTETAWPGSGGGFLGPYSITGSRGASFTIPGVGIPGYQTPFVNATNLASASYRNFPDVAMVAQNVADFYTKSSGAMSTDNPTGGTSASAPLFAGFIALANQKAAANGVAPVGFANPVLYAIGAPGGPLAATCFNDVTTGSNPKGNGNNGFRDGSAGSTPMAGFPAVAGYDLATGLGSPTCALISQLASPTPTVPVVPAMPPGPTPPSFVAQGGFDSCGIVQGALECWGNNGEGEAGTGSTGQHLTPVCNSLSKGGTISVAAGGRHMCAVAADGSLSCWGHNDVGQLGSPPGPDVLTPQKVAGLPAGAVAQVSAGGSMTCALMSADGSVWCWGFNNQGQLGNGTKMNSSTPTRVQGLAAAIQVSVAGNYACAVLQSGGVDCWGAGTSGVLGYNNLTGSTTPQHVLVLNVPLAHAIAVSAGGGHTCAIVTDHPGEAVSNSLYCWGDNHKSQLGMGPIANGTSMPSFSLTARLANEVSGCANVGGNILGGGGCPGPVQMTSVACGGDFTCIALDNGKVECWGDDQQGQLGNGMETVLNFGEPQTVMGLSGATAVASGAPSCAQVMSGALYCWGEGPLGNGTPGRSSTAVQVTFARCP